MPDEEYDGKSIRKERHHAQMTMDRDKPHFDIDRHGETHIIGQYMIEQGTTQQVQ
jgi:hypothetical protein